jgi:hypothetical protein
MHDFMQEHQDQPMALDSPVITRRGLLVSCALALGGYAFLRKGADSRTLEFPNDPTDPERRPRKILVHLHDGITLDDLKTRGVEFDAHGAVFRNCNDGYYGFNSHSDARMISAQRGDNGAIILTFQRRFRKATMSQGGTSDCWRAVIDADGKIIKSDSFHEETVMDVVRDRMGKLLQ